MICFGSEGTSMYAARSLPSLSATTLNVDRLMHPFRLQSIFASSQTFVYVHLGIALTIWSLDISDLFRVE